MRRERVGDQRDGVGYEGMLLRDSTQRERGYRQAGRQAGVITSAERSTMIVIPRESCERFGPAIVLPLFTVALRSLINAAVGIGGRLILCGKEEL